MEPIVFTDALFQVNKTYIEKAEGEAATPVDTGHWIVEGFASTGDLDAQGHVISEDAIKMGAKSLEEYRTVLYNHDPNKPIGKILAVEAREKRLFVKVEISKTEPLIWQKIKDGTLSKFSIKGRITDAEPSKDTVTGKTIMLIKGLELHEVSLVSVPANTKARSLAWYVEKAMSGVDLEKKTHRMPGESVQACVARKIKINIKEGMKPDQASAAAFSMCGGDEKGITITQEALSQLVKEVFDQGKGGDESVSKDNIAIQKGHEHVTKAITLLEQAISGSDYSGESVDQLKSILASLKALVGGEEKKSVAAPVKKSEDTDPATQFTGIITQMQEMVKSVTEGVAETKTAAGEVKAARESIQQMVAETKAAIEKIPIRKGAGPEEEEEQRLQTEKGKTVEKKLEAVKEDKTIKPGEKLRRTIEVMIDNRQTAQ